MMTTIMMFNIFILSWVITRFEPLQMVLEILPDKLITNTIKLLLSCLKCVSFWMALIVTHDIFLASTLCFISFWYDKFIGPIERKVRL